MGNAMPMKLAMSAPLLACSLFACSLLAVSPETLAESERISLSQLAERALAASPALAAAGARREAVSAERREAGAALKPSLVLGATATQYQEPSIVAPLHGFNFNDLPPFDRSLLQPGLRASYPLLDGGLRAARIDQLTAQEGAAGFALAGLEQALLTRLAATYFELLALAEARTADDARIEALEAEHRRAAVLVDAGRAAAVDLRRAEAALATARADRSLRNSRIDLAEREIARLCGSGLEEVRILHLARPPVSAEGPELDRAALLARALAASPRVAAAEAAVQALETTVRIAQSGQRPVLSWFANELAFGSSKGDVSAEWSTGVQFSWSLFDGGAAAERVARAHALTDAARADARQVRLEIESALDGALARFDEAGERVESLSIAVASFADVARVEALRLEAEAGVQSDYLEALAQLASVRAALAEARYRALAARVEIASVVGELDAAWFDRELGTSLSEAGRE